MCTHMTEREGGLFTCMRCVWNFFAGTVWEGGRGDGGHMPQEGSRSADHRMIQDRLKHAAVLPLLVHKVYITAALLAAEVMS